MTSDWDVVHPKQIFAERRERARDEDVHLTPSQTHGVVPQAEYMAVTGNRVVLNLTGQENMKHVEADDFIIHLRSFQGGIEHSTLPGKVSNAYTVLTPKTDIEPRFYRWVLKSSGYIQELNASTNQLRDGQSIKFADFAAIDLPLPPVEEQRRIADFLDDQVARIDGVLADCRELDSQSEQAFQSAVIERTTYAVTGGTIATTGLPWKPFAESSWRIRPMRSFLRYAKDPVGEQWKDYLLLSLTKQGVIPRDVESNVGKFPGSFDTYQAVEPGDLVMCLFDVDETPRTVGLTHERGMVTGAYTRFVWTDPEVSGRFVEYSLIGIDDQKAFRPLYTGMRKGIQTGRFLSARLPIPSNATQLSVVKELDERRHNMELFRTENARRSGLLEERKRALITAAVTGELDVTTARPIGMGKWVPNVGANAEAAAGNRTPSIVGGMG